MSPLTLLIIIGLTLGIILLAGRYLSLYKEVERRARELFERWREEDLEREVLVKVKEKEKEIRQDAISRSSSVIMGKVVEQLAPVLLFEREGINPKDMRFLGTPVDYIIFKGLSNGKVEEIIFLEVKAGKSKLSEREKEIKKAILKGKVSWKELYLRSFFMRYQ